MAGIGEVWDSTTDVLAGRATVLAPIALAAFVAPAAAQSALAAYAGGPGGDAGGGGAAALGGLVALAALAISLWGELAVIAVASDPACTRAEAGRLALRRLPANLLVLLVLGGLALLLLLPVGVILAAGGVDLAALTAAQAGRDTLPMLSPGTAGLVALYALVALGVLIWAGARLFLVNAVVLNERRAVGAIGRSWALTRGSTGRLIAVALLFGIAWLVALAAVQLVVGLLVRLLGGADAIGLARFVAAVAGACVTATWTVVVQVFAARLWVAITGGTAGAFPDEAAPVKLSATAVVRDAGALARRDGGMLAAIAGVFWFLPAYALALLGPRAPDVAADANEQARAAALTPWVGAVLPWYALDLAIGLFGAATVFALYFDRERPAVGAALARGLRLWPRLALANLVVGAVAMAVGVPLVGIAQGAGLIVWLPALLYLFGRALPMGPALAAERPLGALAALARAVRLTRGGGLVMAGVLAAVWGAGVLGEQPLMAIDAWLRSLDGGNPVALAIVDAAAAAVSAAVALGYALVAVAAYRRLARPA